VFKSGTAPSKLSKTIKILQFKFFLELLDLLPGEVCEVCIDGGLDKPRLNILARIERIISLISTTKNITKIIKENEKN